MSLELIVGPPNSGRAGEVLRRLVACLDADPLLIVPTADDIARFERELVAGGAAIGATIRTFGSLTAEVATAAGAEAAPPLTDPQRLALIRAAIATTPLRILARSSRSPGFAGALDALVAELQAALVAPDDLHRAAADAGDAAAELELADLYAVYERLRDRADRSDAGSLAVAAASALAARPAAWGGRPVLVYGFDDLTEAQLELVHLLARSAPVTVAVNYADRVALNARAALLGRLREELGGETAVELAFDPGYTTKASLRHIDRHLFEPTGATVAADDGIRLLESAGERGEAESIGLEVAKLLAAGTEPDDIVIALRRPGIEGPLFARVLREMGVPVALEADLPLVATAVGRSLVALCRAAAADGTPQDLLAHLRSDPSLSPEAVDWLERAVARGDARSVADLAARWQRPPVHLARVLDAPGPAERVLAVAAAARWIAEAPHRAAAPLAGERSERTPLDPLELRAGSAAAELLAELAAVGRLPGCQPPDLAAAAQALESAGVRAWQGSAEGRVRIVSPYRVRAGRARYLFCAALQEGAFPSRGGVDPLLGEESRKRLGLRALRRRDQTEEERYLFHVCVSRPIERLYVSWRSSDEDGHPTPRSPFVDEVLDLLAGKPEADPAAKRTRSLAQVVPYPAEATTPRALGRALALRGGADAAARAEALDALDVDLTARGEALELLAGIPDPRALPGPLAHPRVLGELAVREHLSANSLEGWLECSYRWFVNHELAPQRLEPQPDPLWLGGVVHKALDDLYREAPGGDAIPRQGDLKAWQTRFSELLDEAVAGAESGVVDTPERRLMLARVRIQVEAFLASEANATTELRPRGDLLERTFGFDEEGDPGALELGDGLKLRGRIDRIDVAADGTRAVLRDYKTSKAVPGASSLAKDGKLQLQLYMLAARELLKLEVVGGLYQPLGAYGDRRPRGIVRKAECGEGGVFDGLDISVRGDGLTDEAFDDALENARRQAETSGTRMLAGDIRRDPLGGSCPKYCTFQPICRLERAIGLEDENGNAKKGDS